MWLSRMMKVGRPLVLLKDLQGVLDPVDVVGIADPQDIPAVTQEPGGDVLGEGDARAAFDRDVVVVVDPAEVVQPRWPASDAASDPTPSIMQPSPHTAYML